MNSACTGVANDLVDQTFVFHDDVGDSVEGAKRTETASEIGQPPPHHTFSFTGSVSATSAASFTMVRTPSLMRITPSLMSLLI